LTKSQLHLNQTLQEGAMKPRAAFYFLLLGILLLSAPLAAQVQFASLTGIVTDPTDAVIPGADVTVTSLATGLTYGVKTDSSGFYRVQELPPGNYKIEASASGFKRLAQTGLSLSAGTIRRVDFKLQLGPKVETVTVEAAPPLVSTEDAKLYETVGQAQVGNLPLNGRNVFDLIQLAPGALNVSGVDFENGHSTVVNGLRPNFLGFLINGVSNKGLSGGIYTVPNADMVQEFQELTLNMSAQYGNSAAAIINVITKTGGNDFHFGAYEFLRNDALDANEFFRNKEGVKKTPLRFNQFGVNGTGPIIKDKLFWAASFQGERFTTQAPPTPVQAESPQWRQAVISALPNSTAALIYKNFPTIAPGTPFQDLSTYIASGASGFGFTTFPDYLCEDNSNATIAGRFLTLFGVTAADQAAMSAAVCSVIPALTPGLVSRTIPFLNNNVLVFGSQTQGNLFNGNEWNTRIDWVRRNDRVFGEFYWQKSTDKFGPSNASSGIHGFINPTESFTPNFQFSWVHTFSPRLLNEARVGYVRGRGDIDVATPGVPSISFDDGSTGFGSYNGYPQFFHENVYTYSDMVSITRGKHNMKLGVDFRRNLENSEFNVARPSYYFFDQIFFAADAPYGLVAGVDPGFTTGKPAELSTNNRAWRNFEMGAYFHDDWKVTRNLTLSLGIRYDLYTRHTEKFGRVTTFIPGPGALTKANGAFLEWITNANVPPPSTGSLPGFPNCVSGALNVVLAGVCGPGGFAAAKTLGAGNKKNFGPRAAFAWDPFGKGKTSIRGGFGISYEGTLYNPLSNSRWNPPFYSFDRAFNVLGAGTATVIYGPQTPGQAPTFTGPPGNVGQGVDAQANGNLAGWDPSTPHRAFLTGIVFPEGIKDPYVTSYYFGVQQEIMPKTVLEVNYVGTQGFKLFRAENANRAPGIALPAGTVVVAQGRTLTGLGRRFLNPNYGRLRVWENVSRSWYNALQISVRRQMSRGLLFVVNYAWSHSIDTGSTWHSGATTANGAAAGEGFSLDQTRPELDRGNSIFDIRHRLVFNYVWELPWLKDQKGVLSHILGGWQYNGIWSFQTGPHWSPFCNRGTACDFNRDGERNDRPDAPNGNNIDANKDMWANGFFWSGSPLTAAGFKGAFSGSKPFFARPCLGCNGSLGRNTFVGPGQFNTDQSLFKNIRVTERFKLQFRFEMFNAFNRANFLLPNSATGGNNANRITQGNFGTASGTLNPRQIQFAIKLFY
jgi:hypothetical protein